MYKHIYNVYFCLYTVAKGHSLSKGELLDHEGAQSMAVRMALGETHVIDQVLVLKIPLPT